jgi:hypothetical protein
MAKSVKKAAKKAAPKKAAAKKISKKSAVKAVAKTAKKAPAKAAKKVTRPALKKVAKAAPKKAAPKKMALKKAAKRSAPSPETVTGKRFLLIYHVPIDALAQAANVSPEQQSAVMALWEAWAERCGSQLLDMGAPLINGKRFGAAGDPTASGREVSGYSILSAEDWDDVMSLVDGHPHLSGGYPEATLEIHETMEIPGM